MFISLFALIITLISSVFFGAFDGFRKFLIQRINRWTLLFYLSAFFCVYSLAWILFNNSWHISSQYFVFSLITVILNFLANYFYIKALEHADISNAVPFLAFTSLFTAITSSIILAEKLNIVQIFGIVLIVIASFFINYQAKQNLKTLISNNKGGLLMVLVSLLWAISAPFDKLAIAEANVMSHLFVQSSFISLLNLIVCIKKSPQHIIRDLKICPSVLITSTVISAIAIGLQFYAYTIMNVAIFESLKRALSIISAFFISNIFFKEKISLIKIIATIVIIAGVLLILLD